MKPRVVIGDEIHAAAARGLLHRVVEIRFAGLYLP
jgi:hypothetical protein